MGLPRGVSKEMAVQGGGDDFANYTSARQLLSTFEGRHRSHSHDPRRGVDVEGGEKHFPAAVEITGFLLE